MSQHDQLIYFFIFWGAIVGLFALFGVLGTLSDWHKRHEKPDTTQEDN